MSGLVTSENMFTRNPAMYARLYDCQPLPPRRRCSRFILVRRRQPGSYRARPVGSRRMKELVRSVLRETAGIGPWYRG